MQNAQQPNRGNNINNIHLSDSSAKQLDDRLYNKHKDQYNVSLNPFLQARAQEIASLEHSLVMQESSKHKRTFQRLPRYERRRQMSANPHLLPRNLRKAAINEVQLPQRVQQRRRRKIKKRHNQRNQSWEKFKPDSTIVSPLIELPVPCGSFLSHPLAENEKNNDHGNGDYHDGDDDASMGQVVDQVVSCSVNKCKRLATHMFHVKRMHMEDLWGFRLAYKSTQKIFRIGYRFQRQHCTIHDASYHLCVQASGDLSKMIDFLSDLSARRIQAKSVIQGKVESQFIMYNRNLSQRVNEETSSPFDFLSCYGPVNYMFKQQSELDDDSKSQVMLWLHSAALPDSYQYLESVAARHAVSLVYRNDLARFELRGLHAITVIEKSLRLNALTSKKARDVWNTICEHDRNAASLPKDMILCMESDHPLSSSIQKLDQFPKKKQVTTSNQKSRDQLLTVPDHVAQSAQLWSKFVMEEEPKSKLITENNDFSDMTASVMLIQKDGCSTKDGRNGFGSGFDFICSTQHAAHFFAKMAKFNGVLLLGISERNQLRLEQGLMTFPVDYVDSKAFYQEYESSHNRNDSAPEDLLDLLSEVVQTKCLLTSCKPDASVITSDYFQRVHLAFPWGGSPDEYSLIYSCVSTEESDQIKRDKMAVPHIDESRDVIGCVTSTTYSLLRSHAYALGFVSQSDLKILTQDQSNQKTLIVLVGNENSKHLHPAIVRYGTEE